MRKIKSARSWEETRAARAQGTKCGQKATDKRMAATHMLLAMGICPRDACMSAALKKAWLMSEIASVMPALDPVLRSRSHSNASACRV